MAQPQSRLQGVVDLLTLLSGNTGKTKETRSGGTTTTQTQLSPNDVTAIIKSVLGSNQGLAAVSSGQRAAGLYDSTVQTQLANDLLSRVTTDVAAKVAPTTVTKSPEKVVRGPVGSNDRGLALAGLGFLNKHRKDLMSLFESSNTSAPDFTYTPTEQDFSAPANVAGLGMSIDQLSGASDLGNISSFLPGLNNIDSLLPDLGLDNLTSDLTSLVNPGAFQFDPFTTVADLASFANGGVVKKKGKQNFANGGVINEAVMADVNYTPDEGRATDPVFKYLADKYTFLDRFEEQKRKQHSIFSQPDATRAAYEANEYYDIESGTTKSHGWRPSIEFALGDDKFLVPSGRTTGLRNLAPGEKPPEGQSAILGNRVPVREEPYDRKGHINLKGWTIDDREENGSFFSGLLGGILPVLSIIAPAFGGFAGLFGGLGSTVANSAFNFAANTGLKELAKPPVPDQVSFADIIDVPQIQQIAADMQEEQRRKLRGYANGFVGILPGNDRQGKDNITINVGGGEAVIPTDVVDALGEEFFTNLISQFHREV